MTKISNWLYQISTGRVALVSLAIFLIFSALVLPGQSAAAEVYAGAKGSPDLSLFYSPTDLLVMAESYGATGRQAYVRARFTFDLIFPLIYTFFLAACISWLLKRMIPEGSFWRHLNVLPLVAMLLDFIENIAAAYVIGRYPAPSLLAATIAPPATILKWLLVGGSFIMLGILAFHAIIKGIRSTR